MVSRSTCRNAESRAMNARTDAPVLGIFMMLGFLVTAPFIEVFAKLSAPILPVSMYTTARFAVQVVIMVPLVMLLGLAYRPTRKDLWLFLIRGALILVSTACIVAAVAFMPIADAIAIVFVEPLLLTVFGGLVLGETIGWRRMTASVVGFVGCLMVIQPSFAEFGPAALLPLGTAVAFGAYVLLSRPMAIRIHPIPLQAYTGIAALLLALPILILAEGSGIPALDPVWPAQIGWVYMAAGGCLATVAHMFFAHALRVTPTTVIAPMQYLEIVTAAILGYLIFGDLLDGLALIGAILIVSAGLFVFWRERQVSRQGPE